MDTNESVKMDELKKYLDKNEFPELDILFSKEPVDKKKITDNNIQLFVVVAVGSNANYLIWRKILVDLSNCFWLGVKGSVHLPNKMPPHDIALTMNGVDNIMKDKGAYSVFSSKGYLLNALYEIDRKYGIGENNVMFCDPIYANRIKRTVGIKRFGDTSCFPENWKGRFMSIDFNKLDYYLSYKFITDNHNGLILKCEFSIQFDPLTSCSIQIND